MLSIMEGFTDSVKRYYNTAADHVMRNKGKYLAGLGAAGLAGLGAYGWQHGWFSPTNSEAATNNVGKNSNVDSRYRNEPRNGRTYVEYNPTTGEKEPTAVDMNERQITPKEVAHIRPNVEHARYGEVWVSKPNGGRILLDPPNVIMKAFGNKQYQGAIVNRFLDNLDYYKANNQDHRYDDVIARGEKIIRLGK